MNDPTGEVEPDDFTFTIETGPNTITIEGQPPVGDVFPGEYTVTEERDPGVAEPTETTVEGCTLVDDDPPTATGEIQAGGTERCVFINTYEESATLSVCKEIAFTSPDFTFTVTGNDPSPAQFLLGDEDCVDVTIGPGEYTVTESNLSPFTFISGDSVRDPNNRLRATGEIQAGETQECIFRNETD